MYVGTSKKTVAAEWPQSNKIFTLKIRYKISINPTVNDSPRDTLNIHNALSEKKNTYLTYRFMAAVVCGHALI